jgi:hypothetical protein
LSGAQPLWYTLRFLGSTVAMGSGVEREFFELCAQQLVRTNDLSQHVQQTDVSANSAECVTPHGSKNTPALPAGTGRSQGKAAQPLRAHPSRPSSQLTLWSCMSARLGVNDNHPRSIDEDET